MKESLASAKVSARQQCVYEDPQRWKLRQINARNITFKSTFGGLQRCRWQYGSIFIRLAVVGAQICEMPWNAERIRSYSRWRSYKVVDLGANRKHFATS